MFSARPGREGTLVRSDQSTTVTSCSLFTSQWAWKQKSQAEEIPGCKDRDLAFLMHSFPVPPSAHVQTHEAIGDISILTRTISQQCFIFLYSLEGVGPERVKPMTEVD